MQFKISDVFSKENLCYSLNICVKLDFVIIFSNRELFFNKRSKYKSDLFYKRIKYKMYEHHKNREDMEYKILKI